MVQMYELKPSKGGVHDVVVVVVSIVFVLLEGFDLSLKVLDVLNAVLDALEVLEVLEVLEAWAVWDDNGGEDEVEDSLDDEEEVESGTATAEKCTRSASI